MQRLTVKVTSVFPFQTSKKGTTTTTTTTTSSTTSPTTTAITTQNSAPATTTPTTPTACLEASPSSILLHLQTLPPHHRHTEAAEILLQRLYTVYEDASELLSNDDASKLLSTQDVTTMDEQRLHRLRSSFVHLTCRALLVVGQIVLFADWYGDKAGSTSSVDKNKSKTTNTNNDTNSVKNELGTAPRTLSQLMIRQTWIPEKDRAGLDCLFGVLHRSRTSTLTKSVTHPPPRPPTPLPPTLPLLPPPSSNSLTAPLPPTTTTTAAAAAAASTTMITTPPPPPPPITTTTTAAEQTTNALTTMNQLTQTLSRLLYHCCAQVVQESSSVSFSSYRDSNELLGTHQKVSLIIQRWIKDYTIGKENELYTESVALSTFKEEEKNFKGHMSKLKSKWKSQQQKLLLACFEADHLFCLLVTLDRRFLMQHTVTDEERRLFITTVQKLSKMQQYHNEHVYSELERWRIIIQEGVVFEEGSLLHTSSVKVERALQRRVAAEICNMSFIVLSATYAVVVGGHINNSILGFGEVYTPNWWPSMWFGHSILGLLVVASIAWNFFDLDTLICGAVAEGGSIDGEGAIEVNGFEAMARMKVKEKQPWMLGVWYSGTGALGCSRGMALLMLIVGLLVCVTIGLTVMILRGIGIVIALV